MPWIDLEGADNVRDLGGLPTEDGGTTKRRRLLRGDNLQELSAADISRLVGEIGLTTVVDLRSVAELRSEGPAPLDAVAGVRHTHHPVLAHYLGYLEDRPDQVVAALRSITTAEGAALVHCAAGKDRTGVVVALTLRAVGVHPDAVVADYAATGERVEAIVARLRRSPIYAADLDGQPVSSHAPRAGTMTAFLEQVEARYGGVVAWLAAHGFGPDELQRLRGRLRSAA